MKKNAEKRPPILEADFAYDSYIKITDRYNEGASRKRIAEQFCMWRIPLCGYELELFVTAAGLAFWEIGLLNPDHIAFIKTIVSKGAYIKAHTKHLSPSDKYREMRKRENIINRYFNQISQKKKSPRKRQPYPRENTRFFEKGDVFSVKYDKQKYAVFMVSEIIKTCGRHYYNLIIFSKSFSYIPDLDELKHKTVFGPRVQIIKETREQHELLNKAMFNSAELNSQKVYSNFQREVLKISDAELNALRKQKEAKKINQIRHDNDTTDMWRMAFSQKFISLYRYKISKIGQLELLENRLNYNSQVYIWDTEFSEIPHSDDPFTYCLLYPLDLIGRI